MDEADYHQTDYARDLKYKHSSKGKAEKKMRSLKMRGKKWYARKGLVAGLLIGLVLGYLVFQFTLRGEPGLPTGVVWIDGEQLTVEIAANKAARTNGLMNRVDLPDNSGMLFVWDNAENRTFWMKDTPVNLSVAFINEAGAITEILDMKANSETQHTSQQPAKYALETNQGWFDVRDIQPGSKIILVQDGK